MNENTPHNKENLKNTLLNRIEEEHVRPHSRMFFKSRECVIWALWLVSVLVGALAVAISVFVVTHRQYGLYEATHENWFTFMVEVLPFIWVIVFGIMALLAVYNIKHTKKGYRYSITTVLASSIVLSFAGGSALQFFGLGYSIDAILGDQMPMYMSQEKIEHQLWQQPAEGRLIGRQVAATVATSSVVVLQDTTGSRWRIEIQELLPADIQLLASGENVRLLGQTMNEQAKVFHACGVFSWMMHREVTMQQMSEQRESFLGRVKKITQRAKGSIADLEQDLFAEASTIDEKTMPVCANIAAMRRVAERQ
jgi:heme/copper-type cytochrome/quinol oxidase subunit 2